MRIVFMGTPDFAVPSLRALVEAGHHIVGVFTQPDKPKNRGMKLMPPPVKEYALTQGIDVFQPVNLRDGSAVTLLKQLHPELIVVAAYGKILPPDILTLPPLGCINVHSSLLPKYRGAAPINWAILNEERETGVTIMYMAEGLDTGDMIAQSVVSIGDRETAPELHDRLALAGAELLSKVVAQLETGSASRTPQDDALSCHAPMLNKQLSTVDWSQSAQSVHDKIRGLQPWPVAHTTAGGKRLRLHGSRVGESTGSLGEYGEVISASPLTVACGEGSVVILELQAEGGKRMKAEDYMRGHPIEPGTKLV